MIHLDHILYGVPNLEKGIEEFEAMSGVRPAYGGKHEKLGTHNALVALGKDHYLELIAPDPTQSIPFKDIIFNIGKIKTSRILTWALRSSNLNQLGEHIQISKIVSGERTQEDGTLLKWETVGITEPSDNSGIVPFVICWFSQPHPAETSPGGCSLIEFAAEHPNPEKFELLFSNLKFQFKISKSQTPKIRAKLETPKGIIDI